MQNPTPVREYSYCWRASDTILVLLSLGSSIAVLLFGR
jgi:hypothetical protein